MKTDPKARYQGYAFYFREGFCWIDVNSTYLKARIKQKGVFDVLSMTLFTKVKIPDWYYVSLINSELISFYVDNFINNTSHFQINDARQLPIIIPNEYQLNKLNSIAMNAILVQQKYLSALCPKDIAEKQLQHYQQQLDQFIRELYHI